VYPKKVDLETLAWAASGSGSLNFERVPPQLAGAMCHISAIDFKLAVTITAHATNDTPGDEIIRAIDTLRLLDRFGDVVLDLKGHQLRTVLKACTGFVGGGVYGDPAAVDGGSDPGEVRYCYFRIPFHGAIGGLLGVRGYSDLLQPVDRFTEGRIDVTWGTATPFEEDDTGTITAATLYPSVELDVRREIIQGMDVRWRRGSVGDAQQINVSIMGEGLHTLAITNPDLDHSDYTVVTVRELVHAINVRPDSLVQSWNAECALDVAQMENPLLNQFLPIVFPRAEGKLLGAIPYRKGRLELELTNTNATDQEYGMVEFYNSAILAEKMATVPQSLTYGRVYGRAKAVKRGNMQAHKFDRLANIGPHKLFSPAEVNR
jgi:hypothetical protein